MCPRLLKFCQRDGFSPNLDTLESIRRGLSLQLKNDENSLSGLPIVLPLSRHHGLKKIPLCRGGKLGTISTMVQWPIL